MANLENYFQTMFNDKSNPCLVSDIKTQNVVFVNIAMQKLLKETGNHLDDITNQKCYEVLYNRRKPCELCKIVNLKPTEFLESYIYNEKFDKNYRATNTILELGGNSYNFCKYFSTSSYTNKQMSFEDALNKTIEIFSGNDIDDMAEEFLEVLGDFYQSEKSFVFYINEDTKSFHNKYKWVRENGTDVHEEVTDKIPFNLMLQWIAKKDKNNIIEVNKLIDSTIKTELERSILNAFNLDNLTLCVIENNYGQPIAGVGISNRVAIEFDYRLLKSTTHFIKDGFTKFDMQDELKHIANTDFLTGFFSRIRYIEVLEKLKASTPTKLGVIFVNINGLRRTNEYLGFEHGDNLIRNSANIIRESISNDFYRVSGDEFVGFFIDEDEDIFLEKVNKLNEKLKEFEKPLFSFGHAYKTGNSINVPKLVNESDVIMYINKQEFYNIDDVKSTDIQDNILSDLLRYIANDEFLVYLQPQINLATNEIIGAEALIRRFDKTNHKMIFPDEFIPLYEQKSVIRHIDIFVINQVCKLLKNLIKEGKGINISVNLSRVTLMEHNIVNTIARICDNYAVPRDLIVIEITERIGIIENDVASDLVNKFKEFGFKISLDDFGCAYSNIVTLAQIQVDEVKIDKSLVDNILTNNINELIVQSVVDMCNKIPDTHTLAEGIETKEQADILSKFNCKYGQGYLYSKPIPMEEFLDKYISKEAI